MIVIADTETTNVKLDETNAIIEIAAISINKGVIISKFAMKCWPGEQFFLNGKADKALMINHNTIENLRTAQSIKAVAFHFRRWLSDQGIVKMYAYNCGFDRALLELPPWNVHQIPYLEWGDDIMLTVTDHLAKLGKGVYNTRYESWKWLRLTEAVELLGLDVEGAHTALGDVLMSWEVMKAIGMIPEKDNSI